MSKKAKSISLVLGSGGARGHAHIGVIRAIEERDVDIRNIAGTSMGAVIG
ncbi:MAG: patatin-like phospholipase family protein, partial [Gammaproteobacteria bacterium]|nr:patatin-like phospholipase family protein [Gammaproteobacteria bacterium]